MGENNPLAGASLLASLSPRLRDELVSLAEPVRVRAHDWLFLEGDVADRLYLLVSGRLRVLVDGEGGPRVLRVLGPGAAIGELAVLTRTTRSASVQAVRDSQLLEIDCERFRELVHGNSELAAGLATALARQLQESGGLQDVDAPPAVFAVSAATNPNAHPFWVELQSAFLELGSTAAVSGPAPDGMWGHDWAVSLAELERTHAHVLLLAGPDSEWTQFCLRQADRVVILADGAPDERQAGPDGCDVVFLGTPDPATVTTWRSLRRPRAHHVVPAESELADAARRIARRLTGRSLGLVLSGGGARALAHVGVLDVLADEGIPVDRVGGTSMGAFVAAMVALGWPPERMCATCEAEIAHGAPFSDYTLPRYALIRARRAESLLRRLFGAVTLEELPLPLFTVSADLLSGQMVVHRTGSLVEAVGASMAIPGLAPPVSHDAQLLIDGGVVNNLPIDVMAADEPGPVLAVDVMRRVGPHHRVRSTRVSLPTIVETLSRATVLGSVERAEANRALASLVITPDVQGLSLRDFRHIGSAIDAGRRAAEAAFAAGAREALQPASPTAARPPVAAPPVLGRPLS
jgi:NTE family protein